MYHYPFMCQGIELPKAAPSSNKAIFNSKNSDLSIKPQFPAKQPCTHPEPTTLLWAQKSQIKQSRRASHLLFFWFHPNCSSKPHSGSWVWSGKTKDSDKITSKETAPWTWCTSAKEKSNEGFSSHPGSSNQIFSCVFVGIYSHNISFLFPPPAPLPQEQILE